MFSSLIGCECFFKIKIEWSTKLTFFCFWFDEENKNVQLLGKNRSSYDIPIEMLELNKDLKSYSKQVFR